MEASSADLHFSCKRLQLVSVLHLRSAANDFVSNIHNDVVFYLWKPSCHAHSSGLHGEVNIMLGALSRISAILITLGDALS